LKPGNTCYILRWQSFKVILTGSETHSYIVWFVTRRELDISDPVELRYEGIQAVRVKVFTPLLMEIIQCLFDWRPGFIGAFRGECIVGISNTDDTGG